MWRELNYLFESWATITEVVILALLLFGLLTFLRGTRGEGMLKTMAGFLAFGYIVLRGLAWEGELRRLTLVLDAIFQASVIALVVIFQPELRRGLALRIGSRLLAGSTAQREIVGEVVNAAARMAKAKIGALIALERDDSLGEYVTSGNPVDAQVKADLLRTIFYVGTPLHDGAVIVNKSGRIAAAGCFLPLTDNPSLPRSLGTRHRAGIGLSEAEDALVVIVSEETGGISLAEGGRLHQNLDRDGLLALLEEHYVSREDVDDDDDEPTAALLDSADGSELKGKTTSKVRVRQTKTKTTSKVRRRKSAT